MTNRGAHAIAVLVINGLQTVSANTRRRRYLKTFSKEEDE
jgi:hypothetical protein